MKRALPGFSAALAIAVASMSIPATSWGDEEPPPNENLVVSFRANGGSGSMPDQFFPAGSSGPLAKNTFARKGYTFSGWATNATGTVVFQNGQTVSAPSGPEGGAAILYAVWTGVKYKVVFHSDAGDKRTATQSFRYGTPKALRANPFARKGFVFCGWAKTKGGPVAFRDGQLISNLTSKAGKTVPLHAVWAVEKFAVAFFPNGGSGSMPRQKFVYGKAKKLAANGFSRKGWTFAGWAKSPKDAVKYADRQKVSNLSKKGATVKLYARWRRNRYSVQFLANGGVGDPVVQKFRWGVSDCLPACPFQRAECTFVGWATSPGGKAKYANGASILNLTAVDGKTVRFYAVWAKTRYAVRFKPNGGEGMMDDEPFVWGKAKKLRPNAFVRDGYKFLGWAKSKSAVSPVYRDGASVKNLVSDGSTVVLYAVWKRKNDPDVVLFLGDSITVGFRCSGSPYPNRVASLTGKKIVNRAVSGTTSGDGRKTASKHVSEVSPGTVCILFGANDAIHNVDSRTTKENLRSIIRICKDEGCRPILATPPHQSGSHERFNDGVDAIVSRIRGLAREENVTLVDINAAFGGSDRYLNPNDGLHLSDEGGATIARLFARAI